LITTGMAYWLFGLGRFRTVADPGRTEVIVGCRPSTLRKKASDDASDGSGFLGEYTATRHHVEHEDRDVLILVVRELQESLEACTLDLELHHLLLEHTLDGIIAHTFDGDLLFANSAATDSWNMSIAEVNARGPWGWVSPEVRSQLAHRMNQIIEHGQARFESHRTMPDGSVLHQEIHARAVERRRGRIVVSVSRDITERVQAEEMVRHLAYHDMLTGLANRVLLDQELAHAIASSDRHGDLVGVVFIDLDDFKPINDTYGHIIGDQVLREVAHRLTSCVREYDTVARLGGDEFVVLLPRLVDEDALDAVAHKLADAIAEPFVIVNDHICVTGSLGLALRRQGEDAAALLTRADHIMYSTRERKRTAQESALQAG
jgi:diguanylate cyclase (GGDEF)-like protein/PAS domain S-box-containing protein